MSGFQAKQVEVIHDSFSSGAFLTLTVYISQVEMHKLTYSKYETTWFIQCKSVKESPRQSRPVNNHITLYIKGIRIILNTFWFD